MIKISQAEFPLMEHIWEHHPISAAELAVFAEQQFGWKKNTTYTVIKRLVERGALSRSAVGWTVEPLITREQVQQDETEELIDRVFRGSQMQFLAAFLQREKISEEELEMLKKLIADKENETH